MSLILGVPPAVLELNQKGLLERAFHDGLFPNLAYRAEAVAEEWEGNTGIEIFMSRPGLIPPSVTPLVPGTDPTPKSVPFEQWVARLDQYGDTIDTNTPTSATANADLFLRNIHQQGLQAGQSVNRVARNAMFKAYLSGQTVLTAATLTTDTVLQVAALNGFTDVINPGANVAPKPPSSNSPLPIVITSGSTKVNASVIGLIQSNPNDPYGPGILQLAAPIGTAFAARSAVQSVYAPLIVRTAAGPSVDAIGPSDTLTLQAIINAVAFLRLANVQPHAETGFYHAHISPLANAQVYADPVFQRLNQSLPDGYAYKTGFIGETSGVAFFLNNESPGLYNSGTLTPTASAGQYAPEIGAEVVNGAGVNIGRVLITGKGIAYERYLDESAYVTEAGVTGKIGEFDVINNGLNILTERIRLIIRSPLDRLQQKVASTWTITTCFPIPSDITAPSGPQRFKRGIILEYAT